jgi:ribonucleoside-diphosphate reductase beta chain
MLSWDEFDKEDPTEAKAAPAAAQAAAQAADKLDDDAAGAVEDARAVTASDSDAVARAKAALDALDIAEGRPNSKAPPPASPSTTSA